MRLYDNAASPYAQKVRVTLYEKGIDVQLCEIRSESQRAELLRVSPRGEVPALVDGDTVVYDSTIICEYLEERFPVPPLLPADPAGRARVRALERIADTQLDPVVIVLGVAKLIRPSVGAQHPEVIERAAAALTGYVEKLDGWLADEREWLAGTFSRADVAMASHVMAAAFLGWPVTEAHPHAKAWSDRLAARPSIARVTQEALAAFSEAQSRPDTFFPSHRLHWRDARVEWAIRCGLGPWLLDELEAGRGFFSPLP
jgi:glutathione S-transferase